MEMFTVFFCLACLCFMMWMLGSAANEHASAKGFSYLGAVLLLIAMSTFVTPIEKLLPERVTKTCAGMTVTAPASAEAGSLKCTQGPGDRGALEWTPAR